MNSTKILPLLKGGLLHIRGVKKILSLKRGATANSRYCYTVWMRHLHQWSTVQNQLPKVVAEIGPGATLGTGLAALLSGCEKIYALEAVKYWDVKRNLQIFEELVDLFKNKVAIPNNKSFPLVRPQLANYRFPKDILTADNLKEALSEERLAKIRQEIIDIDNPNNTMIQYFIPWNKSTIIEKSSVDFIFSQAVLQSVNDLPATYEAINQWIKPNGLMSHVIDFKSFNSTMQWNDHWTYSPKEWKIIMGGRSFLINRQPCSTHLNLHAQNKFKVIQKTVFKKENNLNRSQLDPQFNHVTTEDLTISGLYILSKKVIND